MAKQDILDAINATIRPNNTKGITAESLNNVLTMITENTSEGGSGDGALRWWLAHESFGIVNTPEQTQENIATYNKLVEDKYASVILCYGADMGSISTYTSAPVVVQYAILQGETQMILSASMAIEEGYPMECIAVLPFPDGTMEVLMWQHPSTPSSSGPLYLNGDSSHDQDVYNVVFNALSNTEPCPQILMIDSGICASSITVWLDNNLVQNGVAISFYIPTDGGYVTFILAPDGSITPQST